MSKTTTIPQVDLILVICAIAIAFLASNSYAAPTETQITTGSRIDLPVTPSNSVKVDFENGAVLRIPKILLDPSVIPADPNQTIKLLEDLISFDFQYPDMVRTAYPSPFDLIVETQTKSHVLKPDRFPVHIQWLFHSHEIFKGDWNAVTENFKPDWRVARMVHQFQRNVDDDGKKHHVMNTKMILSDSKYEGLRVMDFPITDQEYHDSSRKVWRENGWDGKEEVDYIEAIGSPYELYMRCDPIDGRNSTKCTAYVYMKNNHFQYRMVFPPEAVARTDQLIRTINHMIDGWVPK